MDHVVFLAQENLHSAQLKLGSIASSFGSKLATVKSGLSESWLIISSREAWQSFKVKYPQTSIADLIGNLKGRMALSVNNIKSSQIYNRCFIFFVHELTRTHIYLCCACFLVGGAVGVMIGCRLRQSISAPLKMRAVVINDYSGLDAITVVEELDAPQLYDRNQVLVQVKAAGIDPVDLLISQGYGKVNRKHLNRYNPNYLSEFPMVIGRDCAGTVVSVGADVEEFAAGDQVYLSVPLHCQGTLSEYVVVPSSFVALKPTNLSMEGAASLPYPLMRCYAMLKEAGMEKEEKVKGKRFLIHGGVSSVGVLLIQMVRAWGGDVTVTVYNEPHSQLAALLGARDVVRVDQEELYHSLARKEKFDVIFNSSGVGLHAPSLPFLLPEGVAVSALYPKLLSDSYGTIIGGLLSIFRRLAFFGSNSRFGRGDTCGSLPVCSGAILSSFEPLISSNLLQPVIDRAYDCQDAEVAFSHLDKVQSVGRTIVRFSPVVPGRFLDSYYNASEPDL